MAFMCMMKWHTRSHVHIHMHRQTLTFYTHTKKNVLKTSDTPIYIYAIYSDTHTHTYTHTTHTQLFILRKQHLEVPELKKNNCLKSLQLIQIAAAGVLTENNKRNHILQ